MKKDSYIKYFRKHLADERDLADSECRLLNLYRCAVDWDKRHKHFGSSDISIREIKELYLPHWSVGKISEVRQKLVENGGLRKVDRSRFAIPTSEQAVHSAEQSVQPTERAVQFAERKRVLLGQLSVQRLAQDVRLSERAPSPKEALETTKDNLNNRDSSFKYDTWNESGRIAQLQKENKKRQGLSNGP